MQLLFAIAAAALVGTTPLPRDTASSCVATPITGAYRTMLKTDNQVVPALILVEQVQGCASVLLIIDHVSPISDIAISGTRLTGLLPTQHGNAAVTLDLQSDMVSGTIADGKTRWSFDGRRSG
jgi:hypothetical protein